MPFVSHRRPPVIATVTVIAMLASAQACGLEEILSPCEFVKNYQGDYEPDKKLFMDGTWYLSRIDNKVLPFTLPNNQGIVTEGSMDLNTQYLDEGKCTAPTKSRGQVIALYKLAGSGKSRAQIGSFELENESKKVTLRALGKSAAGITDLGSFGATLEIVAPIPTDGGTTTVSYRLLFVRQN